MNQNQNAANVSSFEHYGKKVRDWSAREWTRFYREEVAPELIYEYEYTSDMIDDVERYFKGPNFNDAEVMRLANYGDADFESSVYFAECIDLGIVGEYPPVFVKLINDLVLVRRVMALYEEGLPVPCEIKSMSEPDAIEWVKCQEYCLADNNANTAERAAMARDFNFLLAKFPSSLHSASSGSLLMLVKKTKIDNLASVVMSIDTESIIPDEEFLPSRHTS